MRLKRRENSVTNSSSSLSFFYLVNLGVVLVQS